MRFRFYDLDRQTTGMEEFRRRMDRLFEEFASPTGAPLSGVWPKTNMYEDKDKVVILAQVPGLGQDQIRIEAHQDTITISGERRVDVPEGYAVHRNERAPFKFARSFGLPCRVDLERTTAQVNNGLLTVSLPKHAEAKPREITVVAK